MSRSFVNPDPEGGRRMTNHQVPRLDLSMVQKGESLILWLSRAQRLDELLVELDEAYDQANEASVEWDYAIEYPLANGYARGSQAYIDSMQRQEEDEIWINCVRDSIAQLLVPIDLSEHFLMFEEQLQMSLAKAWLDHNSNCYVWRVFDDQVQILEDGNRVQ